MTSPKTRPSTQTPSPAIRRVRPFTPTKLACPRSGSLRLASPPAWGAVAGAGVPGWRAGAWAADGAWARAAGAATRATRDKTSNALADTRTARREGKAVEFMCAGLLNDPSNRRCVHAPLRGEPREFLLRTLCAG